MPLAFCAPACLVTWATGLGAFDGAAREAAEERLGLPRGPAGLPVLALLAALPAPAGVPSTPGEEPGRSGLLTPRLAEATSFARAVSSRFQAAFGHETRDTGPTPYVTFGFGAGFAVALPWIARLFWSRRGGMDGGAQREVPSRTGAGWSLAGRRAVTAEGLDPEDRP